jgi:hypothetical protein
VEGSNQPAASNTISTQYAVLDEVVAEEEIEAEQRLKEEEDEQRAELGRKRGMFSWMWRSWNPA